MGCLVTIGSVYCRMMVRALICWIQGQGRRNPEPKWLPQLSAACCSLWCVFSPSYGGTSSGKRSRIICRPKTHQAGLGRTEQKSGAKDILQEGDLHGNLCSRAELSLTAIFDLVLAFRLKCNFGFSHILV